MSWQKFEELVQHVYQQLLDIEGKDIIVKHNVQIKGRSGLEHQVDVCYEFKLLDTLHKVVIECKKHNRPMSKGELMEFKSKLDDIINCNGIVVSSNGFQSGAKDYGNYYGIQLITAGEEPLICKLLAAVVKVLLPDEKVIGQPFWTLMEEKNKEITGSYVSFNSDDGKFNAIGLFFSKTGAERSAKKRGGVVRGVSQRHLRGIIQMAKCFKYDLFIMPFDDDHAMKFPIETIKEYFLYVSKE